MSGTHENYLGWGMRASDGRMVHVNDVQNGLDSGCLCPACKSPLIARQGKHRIWHFAHAAEVGCDNLGETELHLAAKQVLKDMNGQIFIPEETIRKEGWPFSNQPASKTMTRLNDLMTHTISARRATESTVRIEPQDWAQQGFRPDAVLEKNDGQLLIEIRVTHEVDAEKRRRIREVGLAAIEIDLSKTDRRIEPDELSSLIVSEAPRKWLVPGRKEKRKKLEAGFTMKLETEAARFNGMVPRDLTRHFYVNACPRRSEPGFESLYVYKCLDCEYSGGHLDDLRDTPLWNMLDDQIRHGYENSVLCAHRDNFVNLPTEKQKDFVRDLASDDLQQEGGLMAYLPYGWERDRNFCKTFISAHPGCKGCKRKMALRRNAKEKLFWGCSNYPECRGASGYSAVTPMDLIVTSHEDKCRKAQARQEKIAAKRAALARPEAGLNSLSQRATPFSARSAKG